MNVSKTESKYTTNPNKSATINKRMREACDYEDPEPHMKSHPSSSKSENIAAVMEQPLYECIEVRFDDSLDLLLISACAFPCRTQSYKSQCLLTLVMAVLSLLKCEPGHLIVSYTLLCVLCFKFFNC